MTEDKKDLETHKLNALVSVIVPVYNVEKYLRQCLDSLIVQTYQNIEVIMVDDGSKDLSGRICDEYTEKYNNFYVIHKANAGLGMARNTGLEHIQGKYVVFLDSDDYLEKDCIEKLYRNLLENHVDMCKGGFKRVLNSGEVTSKRVYQKEVFEKDKARLELLPRMIGSSPSKHDSVEMCVCGAIYKADMIEKHNLKFPSERELISEDMVFNIDYMQYADGACTIEEVGYNYRVNLKSLTSSYRPDRFEACKHFYLEMKKKLKGLGYDRETILRLDRMFFVYLRMCISQERTEISKNQRRESIKIIDKLCQDMVVREVIEEYPQRQLGVKQRIFLFLLKNKMSNFLYLIARSGKL